MKLPDKYVGKWRIIHMDQWDQDFVDLVVPGYVTIKKDGLGSFQFGAVQGEIDCRIERQFDGEVLSFTWEGEDECDPASGRGWARVDRNEMTGQIFFHLGDDSGFKAQST